MAQRLSVLREWGSGAVSDVERKIGVKQKKTLNLFAFTKPTTKFV